MQKHDYTDINNYSGQALAIILVILVVAAIIGLAIYSRMLSDSSRVVSEQTSAEAGAMTDALINVLKEVTYGSVLDVCGSELNNGGTCSLDVDYEQAGNWNDMEDFVSDLTSQSSSIDLSSFDTCKTSTVSLGYASSEDGFEIMQDQALSIYMDGVSGVDCTVSVLPTPSPSGSSGGIIVSKIYATVDGDSEVTNYKEYSFDDIVGYCYGSGTCGDSDMINTWDLLNPGNSDTIEVSGAAIDGIPLHEIRLRSIGTRSLVKWTYSGADCGTPLEFIRVTAEATCGEDSYVGKTFLIPPESGAPAIFDYVLYNGEGVLEPI